VDTNVGNLALRGGVSGRERTRADFDLEGVRDGVADGHSGGLAFYDWLDNSNTL